MRKKYILIAVLLLIPLLLTGCLSDGDASNKNPVIKSLNLSSQTMRVDKSIDVSVQASDPDGDKIGYSWSVTKGKITGSGANVTYQAPSKAGTYEIKVLVSDGKGGKVTSSKEIQVASNDSPVINSVTLNPTTIQVEETATITVDASDPEGDSLIYAYSVSNGSISGTGNNATYTAPSSTGTYTIEVTVSDGSNNVSTSKDIIVTPAIWQAVYNRGNGYDVVQSDTSNYIAVGESNSNGAKIMKVDTQGNVIWNITYSSIYQFNIVKQALDGGYIALGFKINPNDFSDRDYVLAKVDSQGNKLWTKSYDYGGTEDTAYALGVNSNSYTLVGSTDVNGTKEALFVKVDGSGNQISASTYNPQSSVMYFEATVTADGGYLIYGEKDDGSGNGIPYIAKLDSSKVKQWDYTFSTSVGRFVDGVEAFNNNYIMAAHDAYGSGDINLIKIDSTGNKVWVKTYDKLNALYSMGVTLTSDGGYMLTGCEFASTNLAFLLKVNSQGSEEWYKTYGGSIDDEGFTNVIEINNGYLAVGEAESFQTDTCDEFYLVKTDLQGNTGSSPQ